MATATKKTTRGFSARCPACGQADTLTITVADVHSLYCSDCDTSTRADELRAIIAGHERLLAWLDTAPLLAAE
jgi:Zn ribbon nucleic-acid-binding protein